MERIEVANSNFKYVDIKRNARARRLIFRVVNNTLTVTAPVYFTQKEILKYILTQIDTLNNFCQRNTKQGLQLGDELSTQLFKVRIIAGGVGKVLFTLKDNTLYVAFPTDADITEPESQAAIKRGINRFLKRNGAAVLKQRLDFIAAELGLSYSTFGVTTSSKVLGRCSSKRAISLSSQLLLYPQHLMDYVICHELAHLTEMNHSGEFHKLCNNYCNGRERELLKEFKAFKNPLA